MQALVRFAGETGTPLIARGAGTGLAGEALGKGLIVDLSRNFREILEVGTDSIRVQPGVTCQAVNERLASIGRRFAPDPASGPVCTIGGMLATDASGSRLLRYGYTRDHVQSLRIVLDSGDVCTVGKEPWPPPVDAPGGHLFDILNALAVLLEENRELIAKHGPRTPFDRCGYALKGVFGLSAGSAFRRQAASGVIDLARLLVGSEGTLALFTEATLRTIPVPEGRSHGGAELCQRGAALRAARKNPGAAGPTACELLDRRLLSLVRGHEATRLAHMLPAKAEAVLIVEFESDSPGPGPACRPRSGQRDDARGIPSDRSRARFRSGGLRTHLAIAQRSPCPVSMGTRRGPSRCRSSRTSACPWTPCPSSCVACRTFFRNTKRQRRFWSTPAPARFTPGHFSTCRSPRTFPGLIALAESIHSLALELGGTVSAQHGTGLARTPWVARQFGPLYPVLRQLKSIFDPKNIFNPGKIVDPEPSLAAWPLRTLAAGG